MVELGGARNVIGLEAMETASEAWSTDGLVSESENRMMEFDTDDTQSLARSEGGASRPEDVDRDRNGDFSLFYYG